MTETKRYAVLGTVAALVLGLSLLAPAKPVQAMSTADQPAAIIVWPVIKVNLANSVDTRLQLVNHAPVPKLAHCFYIDGTSGWRVTDFFITLTSNQPVSWLASEGLRGPILNRYGNVGVCAGPVGSLCTSNAQCGGAPCIFGQNNNGTAVPPVAADFSGALKCVQFDPDAPGGPAPDVENSLTGMAAILRSSPDVEKYSAIGLKSIAEHPDNELQLGGDGGEYDGCASTVIVNHLFDDSVNPMEIVAGAPPFPQGGQPAPENRTVHTYLTLIPCSDDYLRGIPGSTTAQFLVFNEFEQRYSTSTRIPCVTEKKLSAIDTGGVNTDRSIWSAHVSGTIAGQTRIQGVGSKHGLLGVARLTNGWDYWADYNVHQQGDKTDADMLILP